MLSLQEMAQHMLFVPSQVNIFANIVFNISAVLHVSKFVIHIWCSTLVAIKKVYGIKSISRPAKVKAQLFNFARCILEVIAGCLHLTTYMF